jgi:5-methyltetrahydropteroyltriglutamate--homocysteine methyltransferase
MLKTTIVGSYPQPEWLIDRPALGSRVPPRVRAQELWRLDPSLLAQAQDDATELAVRTMERLGLDILTDGEIRRESYSNYFATALEGLDFDNPGSTVGRDGKRSLVPRVVGPVRRPGPVEVRDLRFLKSLTTRLVKATVPGPFTMSQQAQDEYYGDGRALALAFADAVNAELRDLVAAGADVVQIDEPWIQARPEAAREFAVDAVDRALAGIEATTVLHVCYGYGALVKKKEGAYGFLTELDDTVADQISIEAAQPRLDLSVLSGLRSKTIILGVLDLGDLEVETPDTIAARLRVALEYVTPDRLIAGPDCGMKYLPREVADGKIAAMVRGAEIVSNELGLA